MNKIKNWISNKIEVLGLVLFVVGYSMIIFFIGREYEWKNYRRVRDIGVEIQTQIIEHRLGTRILSRDTFNVIKEVPKMKADKFD
jgi:hypothetical protein